MKNPIRQLAHHLEKHRPALMLTGAGISTGSGIPAYRNADGVWIHPRPVLAAQFKGSDAVRRRYWRRSMSGWPTFDAATPNIAHQSIPPLQHAGIVSSIVTQNVDGLHHKAGSEDIIELHGSLDKVICLACGRSMLRSTLQQELLALNPRFIDEEFTIGADGDAIPISGELEDHEFTYPDCSVCGGTLKPNVVFFGENVPAEVAHASRRALESAGCLLCIGSSLSVLSGFRHCRDARAQNKPVYLINQGTTRADEIASFKVDLDCADALCGLANLLCD